MQSNISQDLIEQIDEQRSIGINEKTSNMYYCKQCGESNTVTYTKQTRSGDESATQFIVCKTPGCYSRWTNYG